MTEIRVLRGAAIRPLMDDFARLRIAVFREWPYLYDGTMEYERDYLAPYLDDPSAVVVGAFDGERLVGAATAAALTGHKDDFAGAFSGSGMDLSEVYYLAESVLLPEYRGRGLGHAFFDAREEAARRTGFKHAAFCAVIRPVEHPARPGTYRDLQPFWTKRGYRPLSGVVARFHWRDLGDAEETPKRLQFWSRTL